MQKDTLVFDLINQELERRALPFKADRFGKFHQSAGNAGHGHITNQ